MLKRLRRAWNIGTLGCALAAVWLAPGLAAAQECEVDRDCGHGFQCIHDSAGTSSVTGAGGTTQAECGDGICEGGFEDIESCPADCDTLQYCAPAECESDSDCAEGYECGGEIGADTGFTSAGGSSSTVCGDGVCDFDETPSSCSDDCRTYRLCEVTQVACQSDDECADGFYCYMEQGSAVAVSSVDSGSVDSSSGSDSSSSGGVGGTGAADDVAVTGAGDGSDGFAPPEDTSGSGGTGGSESSGVCLPEGNPDGGGGGTSVSGQSASSVDGGSVDDGTSAGETGGSSDAASSGSGGSGGANGSADGDLAAATGSDSSGSDGDGSDSGGSAATDGGEPDGSGDGDGDDDDGGCSCSTLGTRSQSGFMGLLAFGAALGFRRRVRAR